MVDLDHHRRQRRCGRELRQGYRDCRRDDNCRNAGLQIVHDEQMDEGGFQLGDRRGQASARHCAATALRSISRWLCTRAVISPSVRRSRPGSPIIYRKRPAAFSLKPIWAQARTLLSSALPRARPCWPSTSNIRGLPSSPVPWLTFEREFLWVPRSLRGRYARKFRARRDGARQPPLRPSRGICGQASDRSGDSRCPPQRN
jgi:hypothetical protein